MYKYITYPSRMVKSEQIQIFHFKRRKNKKKKESNLVRSTFIKLCYFYDYVNKMRHFLNFVFRQTSSYSHTCRCSLYNVPHNLDVLIRRKTLAPTYPCYLEISTVYVRITYTIIKLYTYM